MKSDAVFQALLGTSNFFHCYKIIFHLDSLILEQKEKDGV